MQGLPVAFMQVPYIFVLMRMRFSLWELATNLLTSSAINMVALYLFLYKDFVAPDGSTGRFMW